MENDAPFVATAGALGNERRSHKKHKKSKKSSGHKGSRSKRTKPQIDQESAADLFGIGEQRASSKRKKGIQPLPGKNLGLPKGSAAPPTTIQKSATDDNVPLPEAFNLAGRPDRLLHDSGLKELKVVAFQTYRSTNLTTEPIIHFVVRSPKTHFMRFRSDCISLVLYGVYDNPAPVNPAAAADLPAAHARHALRARQGLPAIYIDPSVQGTGFIKKIEVSIDNVKVPTNDALNDLHLQYVRCCRIFNEKPGPHFSKTSDINWANVSDALRAATRAFDYDTFNNAHGIRIPIFLDGIFPFGFKNRTLESIERSRQPNLYLPPDTEIDIKLHMNRTKMEAIFHANVDMINYFEANNINPPPGNLAFTFQDCSLEVEFAELAPAAHTLAMSQFFNSKGRAIYKYDIPRGQQQALVAGQSVCKNVFQIMPFARLCYIMFLPSHASILMEARNKPLSGFSTFPPHCSHIEVKFCQQVILCERFDRFGMRGETEHIGMKILYQYYRRNHMTSDSFDQFFPKSANERPLNQILCFDLKNQMSQLNEYLELTCTFAAGHNSPGNIQIVVLTVHPNGQVVCESGSQNYNWIWSFNMSG